MAGRVIEPRNVYSHGHGDSYSPQGQWPKPMLCNKLELHGSHGLMKSAIAHRAER